MCRTIAIAGALAALSWTSTALAQDTERFRLERTEDGYVRMDTKTGAMSICRERSGQLVCTLAADERAAYQDDIADLGEKLDKLEARIAALESGGGAKADPGLPSEEEFEQTMGLMERFFRRFMGMVQDFEKEEKTPQPEKPAPDRT